MLDVRIQKQKILNKGYGLIAKEFIPVNTLIIREIPYYTINAKYRNTNEVFELLYNIMNSNKETIKKFMNLVPKENIMLNYNILVELEKSDKIIYEYFINNFSLKEIELFILKYMHNAFLIHIINKPCILFTGTLLNHACIPNIIFGSKKIGNKIVMDFITMRDINKGEELYISYIDITQSVHGRQKELFERYNFICKCEGCTNQNKLKYNTAIEIEKKKFEIFGYTKSKKIDF